MTPYFFNFKSQTYAYSHRPQLIFVYTVIAPNVIIGGKCRQMYSKTLTLHYSLISKDMEVGQKHFLVIIFTFCLFEVWICLIMYFFMISKHPVFVDDIIFEKSQKVEKYIIDGVKISKTITGDFFLIILDLMTCIFKILDFYLLHVLTEGWRHYSPKYEENWRLKTPKIVIKLQMFLHFFLRKCKRRVRN